MTWKQHHNNKPKSHPLNSTISLLYWVRYKPVWLGIWWASQVVCLFHWRGSSPACHHEASPSPQTLSLGFQTYTPGSRCPGDVNSEVIREEKDDVGWWIWGMFDKKNESRNTDRVEKVNYQQSQWDMKEKIKHCERYEQHHRQGREWFRGDKMWKREGRTCTRLAHNSALNMFSGRFFYVKIRIKASKLFVAIFSWRSKWRNVELNEWKE